MTDSLRDQLLKMGFKPAPAPEKRESRPAAGGARRDDRRDRPRGDAAPTKGAPRRDDRRPGGPARPGGRPGQARKPRTQEEIDLGKAYALRAQKEKQERIAAEAARQEEARVRREARVRLSEFVKDKALNDADADIARHFPYGGKIKRIYVNAEQLRALNAGELGVVQLDGRYLLVSAATLAEAEGIFAPCVALKVDPNAPAADDPYADPQYQVPDDLVW